MYNINFISEIVVAMRKTTRTSCNRLLICLLHDFTECFQFLSRALHEKLFKLVLTYIKNDRELWLSNKIFEAKECKKFLIFAKLRLHEYFVNIIAVSSCLQHLSTCLGFIVWKPDMSSKKCPITWKKIRLFPEYL